MYQVKSSDTNPGFFKVVKAYFIYDRREEHVYQEFEAQLEAIERDQNTQRANRPPPLQEVRQERSGSQESNPRSNPANNRSLDNSPGMIRSSMREWIIKSRNLTPGEDQDQKDISAPKDSKNNSEEMNEFQGRKRVESFEIDFGGLSRSNSSGSLGDKVVGENKINEKLFLRSFDSLNKDDSVSNQAAEIKDDTSTGQSASFVLPPLRPRGRSYETYRGNSPYLPPNDRALLKPIDERDDEHHYD